MVKVIFKCGRNVHETLVPSPYRENGLMPRSRETNNRVGRVSRPGRCSPCRKKHPLRFAPQMLLGYQDGTSVLPEPVSYTRRFPSKGQNGVHFTAQHQHQFLWRKYKQINQPAFSVRLYLGGSCRLEQSGELDQLCSSALRVRFQPANAA